MRHKVPRLRQRFTFQGLSIEDLLIIAGLLLVGWQVASVLTGNVFYKLLIAGAFYYLGTMAFGALKMRLRPGWFNAYMRWLTSKDLYVPEPDAKVKPLIIRNREHPDA